MRRNHSSRSFPADSGTLSSVMAASAACTSRIDWATNSSGGSTGGGGAASNSEVGASSISSNTTSTDDGSGNGCGYRTEAQYSIRDEAPRSLPKRAPSHCCLERFAHLVAVAMDVHDRDAHAGLPPTPPTMYLSDNLTTWPGMASGLLSGDSTTRPATTQPLHDLQDPPRAVASQRLVSKVTLKSARTPAYRAITARRGNVLASLVFPRH